MGNKGTEDFFSNQLEHSKAKLSLLKNYATVWMRRVTMGTPQKSCVIIDTFAGAGYYDDGSEGSPIILIKAAMEYCEQSFQANKIDFDEVMLIFVEKEKNNFLKLKNNIEELIHQKITSDEFNTIASHEKVSICITNNDFESFITILLNSIPDIFPTLMFIDPFGYKAIGFDYISKIIEKYQCCEMLINFMYEEINRFFLVEGNERLTETYRCFYGPNYESIKKTIKDKSPNDRREIIINGYKDNLKTKGAKYTLDFDIEKNGKVKMNIIFCTKNLYGFDVMKEQMQQVCNNVNFEYHTKNPQLSLFDTCDEDSLIESMSKYLFSIFQGKVVGVTSIKNQAMEHPFLPSKYFKKALIRLEDSHLIANVKKEDNTKRRTHTFPDGVLVEFIKGDKNEVQ